MIEICRSAKAMLNNVVLVSLVVLVSGDFYSSKYDDFDVQPLVDNDRILLGYTKCFLDQGPCTPDAKDFKKVIPEALETTCGKCTPKQKELIKTVIKAVKDRYPEAWEQLVDKYDHDRKFQENFKKFIEGKE